MLDPKNSQLYVIFQFKLSPAKMLKKCDKIVLNYVHTLEISKKIKNKKYFLCMCSYTLVHKP
jgi:hypothetical protein